MTQEPAENKAQNVNDKMNDAGWTFYADGTFSQDKPVHGKPLMPRVPSDMVPVPPLPCAFKIGDMVTTTNDYGVTFINTVRGFASKPHVYGADGPRPSEPHFVYLDSDSWWVPASLSRLRLIREASPI